MYVALSIHCGRDGDVRTDVIADFSRDDYQGPPMTNLLDIIAYVKPTALLGLSTITVAIAHCLRPPPVHSQSSVVILQDAFTGAVLDAMAALNPRPIVFPLSNPVKLAECSFADAVAHTGGSVLFASGSPFPEQQYQGRILYPGQGNNMYIFPGALLC